MLDYRKLLIDLKGIKNAWLEPASLTYYIAITIEGNILWPTLLAGEIENLDSFAKKMVQPPDGISKYLSERLSKVTLRALSKYQDSDQSLLQTALVQELNRIIQGDLIYEKDRFASVKLSPETSTLPKEESFVVGLNRLLLEDAYPRCNRQERIATGESTLGWNPRNKDCRAL